MRHSRHVLVPLALALEAGAFVVASALPAAAATPTRSRASYAPSGAAPASPQVISPSGCVQKADNPHFSKHSHDILGKVWTRCPVRPVISIAQSVQLWESRWWGWDRIGIPGHKTVFTTEYGATFSHASCRRSTIRSTGHGSVAEAEGGMYYADTESAHINSPCG